MRFKAAVMHDSMVSGGNIIEEYDSSKTGNLLVRNDRYTRIEPFDSVRLMALARTSKDAVIRSVTKVGMSP